MKNTLFGKVLSSGVQAIAVQVIGGIFFIVISAYLSKEDFGAISWSNAVAVALTMALSFGMDQVVLRRVAATGSEWAAAAYLFHSFIGSVFVFFILLVISFIGIGGENIVTYLPWFFLSQGLIFMGNPLKQLLNAKQIFAPYAIIALISNVAKLVLIYVLIQHKALTIFRASAILIGCSLFELVGLILYVVKNGFSFSFKKQAYFKLIKEALPQYVAVLFDASLARADVIMLGILSTAAITAEYGLAYRAYEIAKLPLTVLSPILLARFARMLTTNSKLEEATQRQVQDMFTIEMFGAMLIPLVLNILWSPVLDLVFKGKYGTANAIPFLILSICIPFQFYINMLWTLGFAARKYKNISRIIAVTAVVNIVLNLALIPLLGSIGAAIAFLVTSILQVVGYYALIKKHIMTFSSIAFFIFLTLAIISYAVSIYITGNVWLQLLAALIMYIAGSILLKQVQKKHLVTLKVFFKKQ